MIILIEMIVQDLWATMEKTKAERDVNATLRRASDLIRTKLPEVRVEICYPSGRVWCDANVRESLGRLNRTSNKFEWNDTAVAQAGISVTEDEASKVNTPPGP